MDTKVRLRAEAQKKDQANKEDQKTWSAGYGKQKEVPAAQGKKSIQTLH